MKRYQALILTRRILDNFNKREWKVEISKRPKSRLGACIFYKKTVQLSDWIFDTISGEEIEDTIRHEIAHVLAGPGKGHGTEWKLWAIKIGASPKPYYEGKGNNPEWVTYCTNCGKLGRTNFHRRPQKSLDRRQSRCCEARLEQKRAK